MALKLFHSSLLMNHIRVENTDINILLSKISVLKYNKVYTFGIRNLFRIEFYFEFLYEPNRLTASELPALIAVFKLINKLVDDEFPGFLNEAERRIKNHFGINSPVFTEN